MSRNRPSTAAVLAVLIGLGLGATPAAAQPLGTGQQQCANALSANLGKVDKAATKQISGCLKNHAKSKPLDPNDPGVDTLEECILADPAGKIAKATGKTATDFTAKCTPSPTGSLDEPFPPYGATDAATVNGAGTDKSRGLAHALFGGNLDASGLLLTEASDAAAAKCQQAVWRAATKCEQTRLGELVKCKKLGLKGSIPPGAIASATDLSDVCLGTGASGQPDAKGKIAKKCTDPAKGILKEVAGKCGGQDLAALFPGCGTAAAGDTASCVDREVRCAVCGAANEADALARDCDLFDDGLANLSCGEGPTPTPTPSPTPTPTPTPVETPTPTPTPEPEAPTAFRLTTIEIKDPRIFPGFDATAIANVLINNSLSNDTEPDGLFDLSLITLLRPLDQSGPGGLLDLGPADCTFPAPSTCSPTDLLDPLGSFASATYLNLTSGTCLAHNPSVVGPGNNGSPALAIINPSAGAHGCAVIEPTDLTLELLGLPIPLQQVEVAARYTSTPATGLTDGLLIGFLDEVSAQAIVFPPDLIFVGGQTLASVLPAVDRDLGPSGELGWWFHLNFTASLAGWTGP